MRLDPDDDLGWVDMRELCQAIKMGEVNDIDLERWLDTQLRVAVSNGYDYGYADGASGDPKGTSLFAAAMKD